MANLVFPEGSAEDPVTGNVIIGDQMYPRPREQENLDIMVNGVLTGTQWETRERDFISGQLLVISSDPAGQTFTQGLEGESIYPEALEEEPVESLTSISIDYDENNNEVKTYYVDGQQVSRQEFLAAGGTDDDVDEAEPSPGVTDADFDAAEAAEQRQVEEIAADENDWRVRLHLAPGADYLYKHPTNPGILTPLRETNGIIFPYTPDIQVQYTAEYENYDLIHSNYRGYFYRGSQVQNIILTATFTANDVYEANYLLASLHFLRSCTKMFYGQDKNRGMPPPVVFLTGLGEYQFNNHPCAITSMHYNLPNDVDYIPCGKPAGVAPLTEKIGKQDTPTARTAGIDAGKGGKPKVQGKLNSAQEQGIPDPYTKATYVPTKIDINFTMIPINTRDQVSSEFSLEEYANGSLLTKGLW